MIDRMLGGSGRGVAVNRALTEIEQNVTDGVVKLILENLTDAWRGIVDVQFRISGRETRPQMLQVAAPNEVVLLMSFEIRIGDTRGVLNICFPAASIEAVSGSFTRSWQRTQREMTPAEQAALDENIGRVERHPVGRDRRGDQRRRVPAPPDRRRRRPRAPGVRADRGQRQRQGQVHRGAGRDGGPLAHPDRGTRSRVPDPRRLRLPMSPLVRELAQVLSTRFAGVMQSVVTPEAEALPFDGAVAPGWLVPCELAGPIAGTWYLAITSEDAARLASRVLMKETASPDEIGEALKELTAQALSGIGLDAPFTGMTVTVGKPATAPVAPGAAAGSFACRLDGASTLYFGCSFAAGSAVPARPAAAPSAGVAAAPVAEKMPDNLGLILDIDMPLTVRFGEATVSIDALCRIGPRLARRAVAPAGRPRRRADQRPAGRARRSRRRRRQLRRPRHPGGERRRASAHPERLDLPLP